MSALGYYDIINELGKNILIYPLDNSIIKNSSIDLTASNFAWSLNTKKSIVIENNEIVIPAKDTAIIITNESIYVSSKICGTYHPKVSLVSQGLSHIATTLDPLFIGVSVLSITNNSNNEISIQVGQPIVSVMLYYVKTPSSNTSSYTSKEFITSLDEYQDYNVLNNWIIQNHWIFNYQDLREKMLNSEIYSKTINKTKYQNKFKYLLSNPNTTSILILILSISLIVLFTFLNLPEYVFICIGSIITLCIGGIINNINNKH